MLKISILKHSFRGVVVIVTPILLKRHIFSDCSCVGKSCIARLIRPPDCYVNRGYRSFPAWNIFLSVVFLSSFELDVSAAAQHFIDAQPPASQPDRWMQVNNISQSVFFTIDLLVKSYSFEFPIMSQPVQTYFVRVRQNFFTFICEQQLWKVSLEYLYVSAVKPQIQRETQITYAELA